MNRNMLLAFGHLMFWLVSVISTVLLTSMTSSTTGQTEEARPVLSPQELVSKIAAQEKKLLNLKVESELRVERRKSGSDQWERTPVLLAVTAWYNGLPGSKARVDVDQEILEWEDGAAPFIESSYSVAFDGQYGRNAIHKKGPVGELSDSHRGVISPDVPPELRTRWTSRATGVAFSTFFYYNEESEKFSDALAKAISYENAEVTISQEVFQQVECTRITYGDASAGHESFWLDPDRGFALMGYKNVNVTKDGRKIVVRSDRVTKLTEAAPGIWFPTEAYHEWAPIASEEGEYESRMHYVASVATANDSAFDESIFTLTFPPGYRIRDRVLGISYRAGLPPKELEHTLGQMATDIKSGKVEGSQPTKSVQAGSKAGSQVEPALEHSVQSNKTKPSVIGISKTLMYTGIIVAVLILFLLAGIIMSRRHRHGKESLLLILCLLVLFDSRASFGAGLAVGSSRVDSDPYRSVVFHNNCGVNVGYVTVRLFGVEVSLLQIAQELTAGVAFERAISFLDLQRTFERLGLHAEGLKADTCAEILDYLRPENVLIVRLQRRAKGTSLYHFVAVKPFGTGAMLIDPPSNLRAVARADLPDDLRPWEITGEFLVVSTPQKPVFRGPSILVSKGTIDLGNIPVTTREIVGEISLSNVGSEPLRIVSVSGPCACFVGHSGDTDLQPGQSGKLMVTFDKQKIASGHNSKLVKIATNDLANEVVKVYFTFFVLASPAARDIRLLPQNIDYGRAFCDDIKKQIVTLSLIIPQDPNHSLISTSVQHSFPSLRVTQLDHLPQNLNVQLFDPNNTVLSTYSVEWAEPPSPGPFDGEIRFLIQQNGAAPRVLKVLLRGEAVRQPQLIPAQERRDTNQ